MEVKLYKIYLVGNWGGNRNRYIFNDICNALNSENLNYCNISSSTYNALFDASGYELKRILEKLLQTIPYDFGIEFFYDKERRTTEIKIVK